MILQIILTIWAWSKGWNWKALLPMACAFGIGLLIGAICLANGTPVPTGVIAIDVLADIALIVMINVKPQSTIIEPVKNEPPTPTEQN